MAENEARGRERRGERDRDAPASNAAKLAALLECAMVCGAVKYKPEGEGGQMYKEKSKGKEEMKKTKEKGKKWNERGESLRAHLRT